MTNVYDRFDSATKSVSAYAITKGAEHIGRVVFKHGDSRLTCFVQLWGSAMAMGWADGGGYDKHSAAFETAMARVGGADDAPHVKAHQSAWREVTADPKNEGQRWDHRLAGAGYCVQHVI